MTAASTFRRLWQPPGRYEGRVPDRRVTFLELFFDLVFVVVISQLAHRLAERAKASLTAMVVLLLAPVAAGLVVWLKHTEPDTVGIE